MRGESHSGLEKNIRSSLQTPRERAVRQVLPGCDMLVRSKEYDHSLGLFESAIEDLPYERTGTPTSLHELRPFPRSKPYGS